MLTRRIGLEPIVPRYPAPARAPAPSEQSATRDEKGAGPFSTGWEQPVDRVHSSMAMILARLAGPGSRSSGRPPAWKAPWAQRIAVPVAGERERRSSKPNGLRKQGGRQRASREQARAGNWRRSPASPEVLQILGGLGKGVQAPGSIDLSHRCIHELATEGVHAKRIRGNARPSTRPSGVVLVVELLCGESRSGPDPPKLRLHGVRKDDHAAGCAVLRGESPTGRTHQPGSKVIRGCARGSNWSQTSAAMSGDAMRERAEQGMAAMEGALGWGSTLPLTRRRVEPVLVLLLSVWGVKSRQPESGSATEGVRSRVTTFAPGRQRREEGALLGGLEITGL